MKRYEPTGRLVAGLTLLAPVLWGTTYVTVTELLPPDRPLFVASMRVLPAGALLAVTGFVRSGWRPRGAEWKPVCMLAVFNFGIFFPLLIVAIYRLPGGVAAAVGGIQPLLVAVTSLAIAGERPRRVDIGVGIAAVLGVAFVVVRPGAAIDPVGVVAAIGANISFSIGVVLTKRFSMVADRLAVTGWQLLVSVVLLGPLALVLEGNPPPLSLGNLGGFAYLSLAATGLAFVLWFNGIRQLPTAAPPLLGLAAPITGATAGWILLGESLSALQLTGFVLTISAITYGAALPSGPASQSRPLVSCEPRRIEGSHG